MPSGGWSGAAPMTLMSSPQAIAPLMLIVQCPGRRCSLGPGPILQLHCRDWRTAAGFEVLGFDVPCRAAAGIMIPSGAGHDAASWRAWIPWPRRTQRASMGWTVAGTRRRLGVKHECCPGRLLPAGSRPRDREVEALGARRCSPDERENPVDWYRALLPMANSSAKL